MTSCVVTRQPYFQAAESVSMNLINGWLRCTEMLLAINRHYKFCSQHTLRHTGIYVCYLLLPMCMLADARIELGSQEPELLEHWLLSGVKLALHSSGRLLQLNGSLHGLAEGR